MTPSLTARGTGLPDFTAVSKLGGGNIGTIAALQGTIATTGGGGNVGTISNIGTVQRGGGVFTILRDQVPLGPGSQWTGSWQDVQGLGVKTVAMKITGTLSSLGHAGSMRVITGLSGTGAAGLTGTYVQVRGPLGSWVTASSRESFRFIRPNVRMTGLARGTLTVGISASLNS